MTDRRGRIVAFAAIAVVVFVAVVPASASAQSASDVCSNLDEPTVVGVFDGENESDEVALYEGTTLRLVFCEDGDVTPRNAWNVTSHDGYDRVDRTENAYEVRITGVEYPVDFAALSTRDGAEGLVVGAPSSAVTRPAFDVDGALVFEEESNRERYETAERDFLNASDELIEASSDIEENANAIRESHAEDEFTDTDEAANDTKLERANSNHEMLMENGESVRDALQGPVRSGSPTAIETLRAVENREATANDEMRASVETYLNALSEPRDDAHGTTVTYLGGGLVGGLLLGAVLGSAIPLAAAKRVEKKLRLSRDAVNEFGWWVGVLPVVVGLAALLVGAYLLWQAGIGVLVEVVV